MRAWFVTRSTWQIRSKSPHRCTSNPQKFNWHCEIHRNNNLTALFQRPARSAVQDVDTSFHHSTLDAVMDTSLKVEVCVARFPRAAYFLKLAGPARYRKSTCTCRLFSYIDGAHLPDGVRAVCPSRESWRNSDWNSQWETKKWFETDGFQSQSEGPKFGTYHIAPSLALFGNVITSTSGGEQDGWCPEMPRRVPRTPVRHTNSLRLCILLNTLKTVLRPVRRDIAVVEFFPIGNKSTTSLARLQQQRS